MNTLADGICMSPGVMAGALPCPRFTGAGPSALPCSPPCRPISGAAHVHDPLRLSKNPHVRHWSADGPHLLAKKGEEGFHHGPPGTRPSLGGLIGTR